MAAKIQMTGNAVVITSSISYEDWALVANYAPKKLVLMGGEDGKDEIFAVKLGSENGSISTYGAIFGSTLRDGEKLATITMVVPQSGDSKEYIADEFGEALIKLGKIEDTIPDAVSEIKAQRTAIIDSIEVL